MFNIKLTKCRSPMFYNQTYKTATNLAQGKSLISEDYYTILSTQWDQEPTPATCNFRFIGNSLVKKCITTQPDGVKYITPATYNFHFMISQITPARGKHLYINRILCKELDLNPDLDLVLVLYSTLISTLCPNSWKFKQHYLVLKELVWWDV